MTAGAAGGEPAPEADAAWAWLAPGDLPPGTVELARALVGVVLVSAGGGLAAARVVETEAYVPGDAASHAFRGRTARNAAMFGPPWRAYVYFIYGVWFCLNVVGESDGTGAAVLLRAAEPVAGLELMRARRPGSADRDLCRGPGRLATALGIGREANGLDLLAPGPLRLAASPGPPLAPLRAGGRIGLTRETERPLRFYAWPCEHVSGTRRGNGA